MNLHSRPRVGPEVPTAGDVTLLSISQATTATFSDVFIGLAFLCFIHVGSKRVSCPINGEIIGHEGDLLAFPPGAVVTLENRALRNETYRADGAYFTQDLVDAVFPHQHPRSASPGIQIIRADHQPGALLRLIRDTLSATDLPDAIRRHRLLEPLLWLQHHGVHFPAQADRQPMIRLRRLLETDLSHPWRVAEVARHFAMSEATLRRWLGGSELGFSKILQNTRLEKGLALLQTTELPVSHVAQDCGFKTQSHFSDAFRRRFGIPPRAIRVAVD
ncbi:helix-turn-helix transcriptional regulator [Rhizobium sp. Leaf341]|uniref:helix-turn-helix transcriptional regulator n=1 Tax=Rhizobium sp. Leaf341 TaxID=1736344 RepID=UPI0009EB13B8|nr:AraC family transcriptional regulator [Rhizobium sp. Leaf341]